MPGEGPWGPHWGPRGMGPQGRGPWAPGLVKADFFFRGKAAKKNNPGGNHIIQLIYSYIYSYI